MNCVTETKKPKRRTLIKKEGDRILNSTLSNDFENADEKFSLKEKKTKSIRNKPMLARAR
jgi:hypothetical protein